MNNIYVEFASYSLTGFVILMLGLFLFEITTKSREFSLIFQGNIAAGLSLGGRLLGLSFVVKAAAENSVSLSDMLLWGVIGIISLIALYYFAELIVLIAGKRRELNLSICKEIDKNNISVGAIILLISCSMGMVIAGCLSYTPALLG